MVGHRCGRQINLPARGKSLCPSTETWSLGQGAAGGLVDLEVPVCQESSRVRLKRWGRILRQIWDLLRTLNFTVKAQRALKNGSISVTGVMRMDWRAGDWKQGDQFKDHVSIQRRNDEAWVTWFQLLEHPLCWPFFASFHFSWFLLDFSGSPFSAYLMSLSLSHTLQVVALQSSVLISPFFSLYSLSLGNLFYSVWQAQIGFSSLASTRIQPLESNCLLDTPTWVPPRHRQLTLKIKLLLFSQKFTSISVFPPQ